MGDIYGLHLDLVALQSFEETLPVDHGDISFLDFGSSIDQLTMFPDYRVPQILAHLGILEYSHSLLERICEHTPLLYGSEEEVKFIIVIF